jgi:hypothetical protein
MEAGLTFIVRIYRHAGRELTGLIEDVQHKSRVPFSSAEELWAVLSRRAARYPSSRPAATRGKTSK